MATAPDPQTVQMIVDRYREIKEHESGGIRRLAADLGRSYGSVRQILHDAGAVGRPGRPPGKWDPPKSQGT